MAIETGGPAFPYVETGDCGVREGMSLRDYFAAKAMQAIISSDGTYDYKNRAIEAYQAADAMLEARK
jgi:hypothetical protein